MESLISGLQHLRNIPGLRKLIRLYYRKGEAKLISKLSSIESIGSIYLKSNLNSASFDFGLSDLDFVIVVKNKEQEKEISHIFSILSRLYPFIKDYDLFTLNELTFLTEFGTTKFSNHDEWKLCFGEKLELPNYYYHPFKFYCDQIDELYFLVLWLYENLKVRKSGYRKIAIIRTLKKIFSVIEWIENPKKFSRPMKQKFSQDETLLLESVYKSSFKDNWINYIQGIKFFEEYSSLIQSSFMVGEDLSFPRDFERYCFSDHISSKKVVHISQALYENFYLCGSIDPSLLERVSDRNPSHPYGALLELRAHALAISGLHSSYNFSKRSLKLETVVADVHKINSTFKEPIKFLGSSNLVSVHWGESKQREIAVAVAKHFLTKQKGNFNHIHVSLGEDKQCFYGVDEIWIDCDPGQAWHKEALYNFAFYFCFGAKKYIFSDAEVYCEKETWLESTFNSLDHKDFVHGFRKVVDSEDSTYNDYSWTYKQTKLSGGNSAQGLVWGVTSKLLQRIGGIPDYCPDGSNDSLFVETVTGIPMGLSSSASWYYGDSFSVVEDVEYGFADFEVIHVNHGKQRLYSNRMEVMGIVGNYLRSLFSKNSIGIFQNVNKTNKIPPFGDLFELSINKTLPLLNNLRKENFIKDPDLLFLRFGDGLESNIRFINCLGVCEHLDGEDILKIGSFVNEKSKIVIHYKLKDLILTELRAVRFIFNPLEEKEQKLTGKAFIDWKEEPFCNNLARVSTEVLPFEYLVLGLKDISELSFEFELNYLKPNQVIHLPRPQESSISMVHSWDEESVMDNIIHNSKDEYIEMPDFLESDHWYALEIDCSNVKDQCYSAGFYFGADLKSVTQLRYFSNTTDKYQRIQVLLTKDLGLLKLGLHFEKAGGGESISIKILKRSNLSSSQ